MMADSAMWRDAVLLLALTPLVYYVLAILAALRFFGRGRARQSANYTPPVSVLKPVRGLDFQSYENFASFCRQEYPDYEILFAVNDDADPAVPVIRRIIAEFPEREIRLLVGAEHFGANTKVNKLARLAREAQGELLVLSDGDVRVGPRYLRSRCAPRGPQDRRGDFLLPRDRREKSRRGNRSRQRFERFFRRSVDGRMGGRNHLCAGSFHCDD